MENYQNHPLAGADDLDSAMMKLWSFYKKYFVGLYVISVIMSLITGIISSRLDMTPFLSATDTTDPSEVLSMMKGLIGPYLLIIAVSVIFGVLLHAWVFFRPLGESGTLLQVLKSSLIALVPVIIVVIALAIVGSVLVTIGLVLLVLPGLFAMLYVATIAIFSLPVTFIETRNPGMIISRSFSLAHTRFWPNMAWVIVVALIVMVISLVAGGIIMLPFTGTFIKALADPENAMSMLGMVKNPLYIGLSSLVTSVVTPVFPILAFILYFTNSMQQPSFAETTAADEERVKVEDLYPKMPDEGASKP